MISRRGLAGVAAALSVPSLARAQSASVLRFVPQADLRILDPVWSTGYITRNYAYLVFDTLLGRDASGTIRPQMAEEWSLSPDGLLLQFRLRPGLLFHDGEPVRAADCIASIRRWAARDPAGRRLMTAADSLEAQTDLLFAFRFSRPFHAAPAIMSRYSNAPYIMPERLARTDAARQVTEAIGSGPFTFKRDEWLPGQRTVFTRNRAYRPRDDAPSGAAGGKIVHLDRVEWLYLPDAATATAALATGEVDWLGYPDADLIAQLGKIRGVALRSIDPFGVVTLGRFNAAQPPFDNPMVRQAAVAAIGRRDVLEAVGGAPADWIACEGPFACPPGTAAPQPESNITLARQLLAASGYQGQTAVVLSAADQSIVSLQATIAAERMKEAGIKVDLQTLDTSTIQSRRTSREPIERGGWSMFFTWFAAVDLLDPMGHLPLSAAGRDGYFGWLDDPATERLVDAWFDAANAPAQADTQRAIAARTRETAPFAITGQFRTPIAYRNNLSGILEAPVPFFWNVRKA